MKRISLAVLFSYFPVPARAFWVAQVKGPSATRRGVAASSATVSGSTTLTVNTAALVSIAITPRNPSITLGTNQQFTATGTYTDGSTLNLTASVAWNSSVPTVATIGNTAPNIGLAASVSTGQTMITASSGSISGSTTLTISTPCILTSVTYFTGISPNTDPYQHSPALFETQ